MLDDHTVDECVRRRMLAQQAVSGAESRIVPFAPLSGTQVCDWLSEANGRISRTLGRFQRFVPVAGHRLFAQYWFSLTCGRAHVERMHRAS
jgi:hypothetical protein